MFASLSVQIDDELQQSCIPDAAVICIHGIGEIRRFLAEILEHNAVVDLIKELTQNGGLHVTAQIGGTSNHLADHVVVGHISLQRHGAVVGASNQRIYIATHCGLIIADG